MSWLAARIEGTLIVDFHGDSAWEKMEFATAVDGRVAAVLGTHTTSPPSTSISCQAARPWSSTSE